jgi:DNA polymerase-3 subunit alpha
LQDLPEREFSFIGLANNAANLESRRGTKYGVIELQDMEGQMEFRLFGEQYLKFMHFLVPGNFLFIKGKVQQRPKYYKSDEFQKEFRILQIDVLEDVRSKLANSLYVQWNYDQLNKEHVNQLENLFKKHKGKKQIIFELFDQETRSYVTLNSRNFKSNISNELIKNLEKMDGFIGYSVNKSWMNNYIEKLKIQN